MEDTDVLLSQKNQELVYTLIAYSYIEEPISASLLRKFRDDFNIRLSLADTSDFEYYLDLYNARDKFEIMMSVVSQFDTVDGFIEFYQNLKCSVCYWCCILYLGRALYCRSTWI